MLGLLKKFNGAVLKTIGYVYYTVCIANITFSGERLPNNEGNIGDVFILHFLIEGVLG